MKLNWRSFIQRTLATLAAGVAGLRGRAVKRQAHTDFGDFLRASPPLDAEVARKAKAIAGRTRCDDGGFLVPPKLTSRILQDVKDGVPFSREGKTIKLMWIGGYPYPDPMDSAFVRGDVGEPIGILDGAIIK